MVLQTPIYHNRGRKLAPIEELAWQVNNRGNNKKSMGSLIQEAPKARRVNEDGVAMLERKYLEKDTQMKLQTM